HNTSIMSSNICLIYAFLSKLPHNSSIKLSSITYCHTLMSILTEPMHFALGTSHTM
ncbi:1070_t:CDS:1, partial [Ambispora gerdemannii]